MFSSIFQKKPSQDEIAEYNYYFHHDVMSDSVSSYNWLGNNSNFDLINVIKAKAVNSDEYDFSNEVLAGVRVEEIRNARIPGFKMIQCNSLRPKTYYCALSSIIVVDTGSHSARVYTLHRAGWTMNITCDNGSGFFDTFIPISDEEHFPECIVNEVLWEQKHLALATPTSNLIRVNMPFKQAEGVNKAYIIRDYAGRGVDESRSSDAAQSVKFMERYADINIRTLRGCVQIICNKGFNDHNTIECAKQMLKAHITTWSHLGESDMLFIFVDKLTGLFDVVNVKDIDSNRL